MKILFLILAIIVLLIAHYFKVYRQCQFIEMYEKPQKNALLMALSGGYIINFIFPFRILGELFRIIVSGRKMKNGYSFALSTIIIDRILDIFCVFLMFSIFCFFNVSSNIILNSLKFYLIVCIILSFVIIAAFAFKRITKKVIVFIAGIFNKKIELKILKFSWYLITSIKDLADYINKKRLLLYTLSMWVLYIISYYLFSLAIDQKFIDVFIKLFSVNNLFNSFASSSNTMLLIYLITPVCLLFLISLIPRKKLKEKNYLNLIPQVENDDRLNFLEGYFSSNSQKYYKNYIKINRDISVLKDYSAGSNATTILCEKEGKTFFRKYAFDKESNKLLEQIEWLKKHGNILPLTEIINISQGKDYIFYDMPYLKEATSCFNYVHSMPTDDGWNIIEKCLNVINKKLHSINIRKADKESVLKYIDLKVTKNIEKIEKSSYIKEFEKYDIVCINGKNYHNLNYYKKFLSRDYLYEIFKNDDYSDIHGDFTIENIICLYNKGNKKHKNNFYLIDPNTGNIHDSSNLDYAKLLQSLHGGYEFLMSTGNVQFDRNKINFLSTKSKTYDLLYKKYDEYLKKSFSYEKVRSIYFHEIVHWLRLIPYKTSKNGSRCLLFYAELLIILDDVIGRWEK